MNNIFNTPQKPILRELTPEEENCISGAGFWSDIGAGPRQGRHQARYWERWAMVLEPCPELWQERLAVLWGGSTRYFIYRMRGDNVKRDETDNPFTLPQEFLTCAVS